jgi:hypothetical protein
MFHAATTRALSHRYQNKVDNKFKSFIASFIETFSRLVPIEFM